MTAALFVDELGRVAVGITGQKSLRKSELLLGDFHYAGRDEPCLRGGDSFRRERSIPRREHSLPMPQIIGPGIRRYRAPPFGRQVIEKLNSRPAPGAEPADVQPRAGHIKS